VLKAICKILLVVFGLSALACVYLFKQAEKPANRKLNTKIIIQPDASDFDLVTQFVENNLARSRIIASFAMLYMKFIGYTCKPGEYKIEKTKSVFEIIKQLNTGEVIVHNIIIYRGWTANDIIDCVMNRSDLSGNIMQQIQNGEIIAGKYEFVHPTSKDDMITKMKEHSKQIYEKLWAKRTSRCPVTSIHDMVVLSSIVAKEAMVDEDIWLVASVFANRMRIGMPLQSDPTLLHAIDESDLKMSFKEFAQVDDPYNSYKVKTLPPLPISAPSEKDIKAVVSPVFTNYLYFIGDKQSLKMHFNKEYKRHVALKKKFETQRKK